MESPKRKDSYHMEPPEEVIQELPQEDFEGSPSIESKKANNATQTIASASESTNSSRSQSLTRSQSDPPNIVYPQITSNFLRGNTRRGSLQMMDSVEAVEEEEAEEKGGETKHIKLKQIKNFVDYGEFNTTDQRRSRATDKTQNLPRARSFEKPSPPLEKVQEAKNEEERLATTHLVERKWMELKDNDEFNTKDKKNKPSVEAENVIQEQKCVIDKKPRACSLNIDDNPIPEEDIKEFRARIGHIHHIPSPKINKLKVDEIDLERNKSEFEQYAADIDQDNLLVTEDVIKEDASEYGQTQQAEEILEKAKQKMTGEKEFIKKFLRNETNNEIDTMRTTLEREMSSQNKNERVIVIDEEDDAENQE